MNEPARGGNGHRGLKEMGVDQQVAFLNSILESSSEYSIVAMDLAGTILAWNAGARRIYGYEAADVLGKATSALLHHPDDVKSGRAKAILEEAVRTGIGPPVVPFSWTLTALVPVSIPPVPANAVPP